MTYKKILTWACTAALFLTGCTTDTASNGRWMDDSNAVRIQASAGSTLTRSNPIDESKLTGFNQGDMISVCNRNITVNYTLNGEIWQPVDNDKYLVWDKNNLKFEAYYPYDGKNTFSVGCIKKNQSTPEALAQSDYMNITYNVPKVPSDKHLTLKLERKTARLIFKIQKFNDEFSTEAKVTELKIYCPEKTNWESDDWDPITPYQNGDGGKGTTYTALVIPGVINAKLNTSETHSYLPDEEPEALELETGELKAGYSYTYNLIVGKNKVTVGGVTVAEWTPGTPLQGGEAKEEPPYVTMTANSEQTFNIKSSMGSYDIDLEYSVNNKPWQKFSAFKDVEFGGNLGSLRLRGQNLNGTATDYQNYATITFSDESVKVDCSGDIRTLIDYTAYDAVATENCSFISLFKNCKALRSAPQLLATALKESCYRQMFEGCTSLTQAPVLPATELQQLCYYSMFKGCTSLTEAPKLPATKLAHSCYKEMFEGCISLDKAPDLPATTLNPSCYYEMFKGCIALTKAPELKAEQILNASCQSMFEGCTSLDKAPDLPATTLAANCYIKMFKDCKSLKTAPILPAGRIDYSCYNFMFQNCTSLESVTMQATSFGGQPLVCWLDGAGTNAETRTLKVYDKETYNKIVTSCDPYIPDNWKIGACTVLDINDKEIK